MAKKIEKTPKEKLNDGHYLEAMDRMHVQMCMINDHILDHPVVEQDKELRRLVIASITRLVAAYQIVGTLAVKQSKKKTKL